MTQITIVETPRRKPRKSLKRHQGRKKRKKTIVDLWRLWLVPDNAYRRFTGLRGIYWYWLSRQVREEEWIKWQGKCLTCLVPLEMWQEGDCGHIVASQGCGEYLRLNRINLTLQHKKCNNPRFSPNAAALNAIHYDERYGQGAYQRLYNMRKLEAKEPSQEEYRQLIQGLPSYQKVLLKTLSP